MRDRIRVRSAKLVILQNYRRHTPSRPSACSKTTARVAVAQVGAMSAALVSLSFVVAGGLTSRNCNRRAVRDVSRRAGPDNGDPTLSSGGDASLPKSRLTPDNFVEVALSPEDLVRAQYKDNAAEQMGDSILGGQSVVIGSKEEMRDLIPFGANNLAVLRATKQYAEAFESGKNPSVVVAKALGVSSLKDLSPAQAKYAEKVRAKLEENAQRMRGYTLEAKTLYVRISQPAVWSTVRQSESTTHSYTVLFLSLAHITTD